MELLEEIAKELQIKIHNAKIDVMGRSIPVDRFVVYMDAATWVRLKGEVSGKRGEILHSEIEFFQDDTILGCPVYRAIGEDHPDYRIVDTK